MGKVEIATQIRQAMADGLMRRVGLPEVDFYDIRQVPPAWDTRVAWVMRRSRNSRRQAARANGGRGRRGARRAFVAKVGWTG